MNGTLISHTRLRALVPGSVVLFLLLSFYWFFLDAQKATREYHPDDLSTSYNASLGFGKVLMISLPSRTDRRDAMSLAFHASGMAPAEYIPGVLGEDVEDVARPFGAENVNTPQIGCWRAHANAWKRVVDEGWETALILEDDTDWNIDIKLQLDIMSKALKQWREGIDDISNDRPYGNNWDLFSFGHCLEDHFNKDEESYVIYPDPTVLPPEQQTSTDRQVLSELDVPEGHRVLSRAKGPVCTMGYAVTLQGAQRLLYKFSLERMSGPIDIEIMIACAERSLQCLAVNPTLIGVYRAPGPSRKYSDIEVSMDPNALQDGENPMGPRSVKSLLRDIFGSPPRV